MPRSATSWPTARVVPRRGLPELGHVAEDRDSAAAARAGDEVDQGGAHGDPGSRCRRRSRRSRRRTSGGLAAPGGEARRGRCPPARARAAGRGRRRLQRGERVLGLMRAVERELELELAVVAEAKARTAAVEANVARGVEAPQLDVVARQVRIEERRRAERRRRRPAGAPRRPPPSPARRPRRRRRARGAPGRCA